MTQKCRSYRHSQEFAISEVCRNVVRLGSQGLSVPVFGLRQPVQSYVGLSCESKARVESGVKLAEVKTSLIFPIVPMCWGLHDSETSPQSDKSGPKLHFVWYFYLCIRHRARKIQMLERHSTLTLQKLQLALLLMSFTAVSLWYPLSKEHLSHRVLRLKKLHGKITGSIGHSLTQPDLSTSRNTSPTTSPDPPPANTWENNNLSQPSKTLVLLQKSDNISW